MLHRTHRFPLLLGLLLLLPGRAHAQEPGLQVTILGAAAVTLSTTELAALPRDSVQVRVHDGPAQWYAGPRLLDVLRRAGARVDTVRGPALAQYVLVEARDGYRVVFGLGELTEGLGGQPLLLANRVDGAALSDQEGPWRLIAPGDTRAARWARQVVAIRLVQAP